MDYGKFLYEQHKKAHEALLKQFPPALLDKYLGKDQVMTIYEGKGCAVCHNAGYTGRVGIFEVMVIDDELRQAILSQQDAGEIAKLAKKNGMTTLMEDGLKKVSTGITTLEEVLRVAKD